MYVAKLIPNAANSFGIAKNGTGVKLKVINATSPARILVKAAYFWPRIPRYANKSDVNKQHTEML